MWPGAARRRGGCGDPAVTLVAIDALLQGCEMPPGTSPTGSTPPENDLTQPAQTWGFRAFLKALAAS